MIEFKLNGNKVQGEDGQTILQVAEKYGVEIPTLCHHKALTPAGMCRMCTVEMFDGRRTKFVTACNYPIWEGMEITTDSDTLFEGRKLIAEMLLSRCSNVPEIQEMAKQYGVEKPRFECEDGNCILCGLCVRVCEKMGNSAITLTGRGLEMKVDTPFNVQTDVCRGCGACEFICPTGAIKLSEINKNPILPIPSEYELGLVGRKPVYVPYAQAVPNTPAIDREYCMHFKTGGCQICTEVCGMNAIDHNMKDEFVELEVGSIVLSPGAKVYDPGEHDTYGYKNNPDVVTSLEFERMLSASGPYGGHLVRPSDHVEPKKIAWIQCVGSRDEHLGGRGYCSGVCCTYAVKEAMLAKDHCAEGPDGLDAAIFYIDLRTTGKDFEKFYNRAKDDMGVRFVKSKVTGVSQNPESNMQVLRYVDESGKLQNEDFDIVVLSVGFEISEETKEMAKRLGLETDRHGFALSSSFNPVETSRPGVYVCGTFSGPKDIPTSVIDSSAAAGATGGLLADSRFTLTKTADIPPEKSIKGDPVRIGVFLCCCGTNIAGVVDMPRVEEFAKTLPNVAYVETNMYSCSQDTQDKMAEVIKEQDLNRVVVAACTPKTHEPLFQETLINASLNKYLFEMANVRNHCSWVHKNDPEAATVKAMETVRMSVAKAALADPLQEPKLQIKESALVIGGGVAGMEAAKNLASQGYPTHIVEKSDALGGQARLVNKTWRGENVQEYLDRLIKDIESNDDITVYKSTEVTKVDGFVGAFKTTVSDGSTTQEIEHGVTIFACGASELVPNEHCYGTDQRVVTGLELEKRLMDKDQSLAGSGAAVFIQCVGSRNKERPYCSKLCCTQSVKNALELKALNPNKPVFVLYRDMRPYGLRENLYREAREKGVVFIRYNANEALEVAPAENSMKVTFTDYVLSRKMEIDPDVVVLASAIVPEQKNPLAQFYKVSQNDDGFFAEAHVKLRPNDFATDGVFLCGLAHGPKPLDESIAQAQAAAARAVTLLSRKEISVAGTVASVDAAKCSGCSVCASICPYSAPIINSETGKAEIQSTLCKGCGLCVASCRSGAIHLAGFDSSQIFSMIDAL